MFLHFSTPEGFTSTELQGVARVQAWLPLINSWSAGIVNIRSQAHPHGNRRAISIGIQHCLFEPSVCGGRCGKIHPGVSNVSNASLFGESYFGLGSVPLLRQQPVAQGSARNLFGPDLWSLSESWYWAPSWFLSVKKKYNNNSNCPSKVGEGTLPYCIVNLLHQWTQKFKEFLCWSTLLAAYSG